MRGHHHVRVPFGTLMGFFQFVAELPMEIEIGAQHGLLVAIREYQTIGHVLAAKVHVRHEPGQFRILSECQFANGFVVCCAGRNGFSNVDQVFGRHDDERRFAGAFASVNPTMVCPIVSFPFGV